MSLRFYFDNYVFNLLLWLCNVWYNRGCAEKGDLLSSHSLQSISALGMCTFIQAPDLLVHESPSSCVGSVHSRH